jgi:hypothetical protein
MDTILLTLLYIILLVIAQIFSITASYITIPYKNLTTWEAYKMVIPLIWIDWVFLTKAISIAHKYKLLDPTNIMLMIIIIQFSLVLLINKFYLHQQINISDYIAFFMIFVSYIVNIYITKVYVITPILDIEEENELSEF